MTTSSHRDRPLVVCYVPGLDARRIDERRMPFVHRLRARHPVVELTTLPNTELLPTMVTGVWPHEHRVWQVSLRPWARRVRSRSFVDLVPDLVTTTAQCVRHVFDPGFDLAAVPARRRRTFELHRFKYTRRERSGDVLARLGDYPSVFGLLGAEARYVFTKDFADLDRLARELPSGDRRLEFLEMYALDLMQHWHLDDPRAMAVALARTDRFVCRLAENCDSRGARLMLLVDHGQEAVTGTIPLLRTLRRSGVPEREYSYFVELALARLWFHTERARRAIGARLAELRHTTLLTWRDMARHDVAFEDDAFGELYVAADAGRIFFPHDFYQPLANVVLGLTDRHQRPRFRNPLHRGNHGYLPHHPSERGFMLLADEGAVAERGVATLIDVAPTLLALIGRRPADHMRGRPAVRP